MKPIRNVEEKSQAINDIIHDQGMSVKEPEAEDPSITPSIAENSQGIVTED